MDHLEVPLKHYNKYLNDLTAFARGLQLKIIYRVEECDGIFSVQRRNIYIDKDLGEANTIAVLLHELGHALQAYFGTEYDTHSVERAYWSKRPSKKQKQLKFKYELEAWTNGYLIAKALKIKTGTWYLEISEYYLSSFQK